MCQDWALGPDTVPANSCMLGSDARSILRGPDLPVGSEIWQQESGGVTSLLPHFWGPVSRMARGCRPEAEHPARDQFSSALPLLETGLFAMPWENKGLGPHRKAVSPSNQGGIATNSLGQTKEKTETGATVIGYNERSKGDHTGQLPRPPEPVAGACGCKPVKLCPEV